VRKLLKKSTLLFFIITSILTINIAAAWDFDMFSFFRKKAPSTIHKAVGAQLVKLDDYPEAGKADYVDQKLCQKVEVENKNQLKKVSEYFDAKDSGALFRSKDGLQAMVNQDGNALFNLWQVKDGEVLSLEKKLDYSGITPKEDRWLNYHMDDLACLPNDQLLVSIDYVPSGQRIETSLYLYNIEERKFSLFKSNVDPVVRGDKGYFHPKAISDKATLGIYYSGRKRRSSEFYHNYYNHLVLFSDQYPKGLEFLKLGIDDGSIFDWQVKGQTLFLHTTDDREHKKPIIRSWSLDLSKILTN
jgi:hypothetical protein